jgi:hypothetical protein
MSQEHPFGDLTHLLIFRRNNSSYQVLLAAAIEVVTQRETLMPITPADLFQRHFFLGGNIKKLNLANSTEEKATRKELRALYDQPWQTTYEESFAFRLIREFLVYAVVRGDAFKSPAFLLTGHEIEGFVLCARTNSENPKIGDLCFYSKGLKTSYKNGNRSAKELGKFIRLLKRKFRSISEGARTTLTVNSTAEYYKTNDEELFGKHRAAHILRARKMIVYTLAYIAEVDKQKVADVFNNKKVNVISSMDVFSDNLEHAEILQEELADILALILQKIIKSESS